MKSSAKSRKAVFAGAVVALVLSGFAGRTFGSEFIYVGNLPNSSSPFGSISAYTIDTTTGALTPVPGSPFGTGKAPFAMVGDPSGKFLYVTSRGSSQIWGYTIDATTGALTSVPGSPYAAESAPQGIVVDPSGKFVYAIYFGYPGISGWTVNSTTGALTPVVGSPFAFSELPSGADPRFMAVHPSGKFLYLTDFGANAISVFAINGTTGTLSTVTGSPFTGANQPAGVAVGPSGKFLYEADFGGGTVSVYAIDGTTGALSLISSSPFAAGASPYGVAVDPLGKFVYVANSQSDDVSAYTIDGTTGALTVVSGSPFNTAGNNYKVAVDPSGKFTYVMTYSTSNISAYAIDGTTGVLSPIAGSPYATTNPFSVAIVSTSGSAPNCVASPSGMVSWWPGEGNANDIIGGNNGTLQNGATFASGKVGQAFSFDGVAAAVDVSHNANQNTGAQITVDAWIWMPNPLSGFTTASIINKRSPSNTEGYTFELVSGFLGDDRNGHQAVNNGLQFEITTPNGSFVNAITTSNVIGPRLWYHVAGTYDGSTIRIFVNGSEVASKSATGSIVPVTDDLVIGRNVTNGGSFPGLIDEVELFNRALSQTEIQGIFNAGSAGKCKQTQTTLSVAVANAAYGGTANLQATLTRVSDNSGISGKTISFTLNNNAVVGTPVTSTSGVATLNGVSLAGINVGTYPTGVGASFAGDASFAVSSGTAQLTISKANATVTLGNLNSNYDGTAKSATATTTPSGLTVTFTYNGSATAPKNAGSYTVVGTINDNNYQGSATGTLTINKVPLTITAKNASRPYGAPNPPLGATYAGFVGGEGPGVLTGACSTTAISGNGSGSPGSPPGNYKITCSGQTSNNYNIIYVAGTLTVLSAPLVSLSATSIVFPNQLLGVPSGQRNVTLKNTGTATLNLTIGISGDFLQTNSCGNTVVVNAICVIRVRFTPTATGTRTGAVTITDNAYDSPQMISLSGTGIAAVVLPTNLTFAARHGTTSPPQLVFLININNAAMSVSSVTTTGPFSQTNNCVPSLPARSPCIIRVSFVAPIAPGSFTGTLQINDSDPSSPQSVALTGTSR